MKLSRENTLKSYKIASWTAAILLIISLFIISYQDDVIERERFGKEVVLELFMFTANMTNYCAESNNMTYDELSDSYILNMTLELLDNNNSLNLKSKEDKE